MINDGQTGFISRTFSYNVCGFGYKYDAGTGYLFMFSGAGIYIYRLTNNGDEGETFYKIISIT